jgi:TetR/AcrR family transcriptional repressor of nem operon
MGRVSRAQAQENRKRVVETASRLFREQGTQVSVADLMKAVGLTHGGFYKQFASKEALIDEATARAFAELTQRYTAEPRQRAGQQAFIDAYLSVEHRDNSADGCPAAALAGDMARHPGNSDARRVYTEGVAAFADWLATDDQDGITRLCTMIGALLLARATKDDPLSEQILTTARAALTATA